MRGKNQEAIKGIKAREDSDGILNQSSGWSDGENGSNLMSGSVTSLAEHKGE